MRILVIGASGLVGKQLIPYLRHQNHTVMQVVRDAKSQNAQTILWKLDGPIQDVSVLENFDVVINLAGENIASGRWSKEKKEKILNSRVYTTRLLSETISKLKNPPKLLLNASATGYYGDRGNEVLTEDSTNGRGFLAEVCKQWESSTFVAEQKGIRVVHMRFGMILSKEGGALAKMLTPFKLGLGGPLGSGKQYISWIMLDEILSIIEFLIANQQVRGAVNVVAPHPVTNYEFTKDLGRVLKRPTIFRAPAFILRFLLGEMADELLLSSTRAVPEKLLEAGYAFRYPMIEKALLQNCSH